MCVCSVSVLKCSSECLVGEKMEENKKTKMKISVLNLVFCLVKTEFSSRQKRFREIFFYFPAFSL